MRKIQPLIFIPKNVKFVNKFNNNTPSFVSLEEKIKQNPALREKFRCEAKIAGGLVQRKKKTVKAEGIRKQEIFEDQIQQTTNEEVFNGPKDYIKNMTPNEILLDFGGNKASKSREEMRYLKPKTIKYFLAKYELTEEELNSSLMKRLYATKMICDVSESQYRKEMEIIKERERREKLEIERRKSESDIDRDGNVYRNRSGVRSLNGVTVEEVDMRSSGGRLRDDYVRSAKAGDGSIIHFDINEEGPRGVDREESEINSILNSMPDKHGGSVPSDMFTMKEYKI
jgi:hypothetical protein